MVFVVDAGQNPVELLRQCHQIGYDEVAGELGGGITAWVKAGFELRRTPVVKAGGVRGRVLDVRQHREHAAGHIPGVAHIELGRLASLAAESAPMDAVMCAHGESAATAASLLERAGRPEVAVVVGGPADWAAATGQRLARL